MNRNKPRWSWAAGLLLVIGLASCRPAAAPSLSMPVSPEVLSDAARQATQIVSAAQATALILKANAEATAIAAVPAASIPSAQPKPAAAATAVPGSAPITEAQITPEALIELVRLVGVGFAGDGAYIIVNYLAPPQTARKWQAGQVYVIDEATGRTYNQVPVMPVIGPLFSRPVTAGQVGYVMLVNTQNQLKTGALLTVVLGDFKQEHVRLGQ